MNFRSFCSGIGAPEQAWTTLGWRCLSTSEIDPQAAAVLEHRHGAPNLGDMTDPAVKDRITHERAELFVAGTPCQSFSVAGLRAGMADPRGNLALVFLGLVDAARPEWVVWENVPGVLSSNSGAPDSPPDYVGVEGERRVVETEYDEGSDFGCFCAALGQLGYGWAYRVLDAQYVRVESHARAVPQRRRRVFVVGHLGDWRRAAAVLFERGSLCGHPAPRRTAGAGVASALTRGLGSGVADAARAQAQWLTPDISPAMKARDAKGPSSDGDGDGLPLVVGALPSHHTPNGHGMAGVNDQAVNAGHVIPMQCNGSNVGTDLPSLRRGNGGLTGGVPAIAFRTRIARNGRGQPKDTTDALTSCAAGTHADSKPHVAYSGGVRRLMPIECERLQGFPDHYTQVPWKGKPMADAPRYRMLGNSMAVNVMSWIGQRIEAVRNLREERAV